MIYTTTSVDERDAFASADTPVPTGNGEPGTGELNQASSITSDDVLFTGGGGASPAVLMWETPSTARPPTSVSRFARGYSVYAMSVSPSATRLAAGTRAGLVRVHALEQYQAKRNARTLFEVFHGQDLSTGVLALAFVTDDILASGGQDGRIKFWNLPLRKQVGEVNAHAGGVVALCPLGSLVLASVGMDGVLRIWDLDTLRTEFEGEPFTLPKVAALTGLDFHAQSGLLMHASGTGDLHAYEVRSAFAHRVVDAHRGDFCALACGMKSIATMGMDDLLLKIWPPDLDSAAGEFPMCASAVSATWAGPDTLVCISSDGLGQVWDVPTGRCANLDTGDCALRLCVGLPSMLIAARQAQTERSWREERVIEARALIPQRDAEARRRLSSIATELRERGYGVEAGLLVAGAAQADNQPLRELETLLVLAEEVGDRPFISEVHLALGGLLERLHEPEMAEEYYTRAAGLRGGESAVQDRILRLKAHPWRGITPDTAVRADLIGGEKFHDELQKHTLLNKPFLWRVVFETRQVGRESGVVDLEHLTAAIQDSIRNQQMPFGSVVVEPKTLVVAEEQRQLRCLYLRRGGRGDPLSYVMEARPQTNATVLVVHAMFDASSLGASRDIAAGEHNERVKDAWQRITRSSETKAWLASVHQQVLKECRRISAARGHGW